MLESQSRFLYFLLCEENINEEIQNKLAKTLFQMLRSTVMTHYNETKQSFLNKTKNIIIKVVAEIKSLLSGEFRKEKELEFNIISGNVSWLILRPLHLPLNIFSDDINELT